MEGSGTNCGWKAKAVTPLKDLVPLKLCEKKLTVPSGVICLIVPPEVPMKRFPVESKARAVGELGSGSPDVVMALVEPSALKLTKPL